MPTYELRCSACERKFDFLAKRFDSPNPPCPYCRCDFTQRLISAPAIVWSKPLVAYGDSSKENFSRDQKNGGHWVLESKSDRAMEKGGPIKRYLATVADQNDYCRQEGLMRPSDLPNNLSIAKDGKRYETANISEI